MLSFEPPSKLGLDDETGPGIPKSEAERKDMIELSKAKIKDDLDKLKNRLQGACVLKVKGKDTKVFGSHR